MEPRNETEVRMPNLVFERVCPHLCPQVLQSCRLVCKAWNDEACKILQEFPVSIWEGDNRVLQQKCNQRLSDFLDLLASRQEEISHPFRKISIKGTHKLKTENFWDLILQLKQYKDIEVYNLEFEDWIDDQKSIDLKREIMTWAQDSLRSLSLTIKAPFLVNQFEWKLEKLEKLEICRNYDPLEPLNIGKLLQRSSIKTLLEKLLLWPNMCKMSLKIDVYEFELLKELLSIEKIRHAFSLEIPKLDWIFETESSKLLSYFTQNPFPNLKILSILGEVQFFLPLIGIFAQSLEIISQNQVKSSPPCPTPLVLDVFPTCPRLRELHLFSIGVIENSFSEKFPSLKKMNCKFGLKILGEVEPHFGVEYLNFGLTFISNYENSEHISEICTCCKVGQDILQYFPHLNHNICQAEHNLCAKVETLWSVSNYFPNVRALRIKDCGGLVDFVSELGTTLFKDAMMDVRFEKVFQKLFPLQNFRQLDSLDLKFSEVSITPILIRQCLGKIPTLKHLSLPDFWPWPRSELDNGTLEAFVECLQHLNHLRFTPCSKGSKIAYSKEEALKAKLFPLPVSWFCNYTNCDCILKACKCQHCKNAFPFF